MTCQTPPLLLIPCLKRTVHLIKASNLYNADGMLTGKSDAYCVCFFRGPKGHKAGQVPSFCLLTCLSLPNGTQQQCDPSSQIARIWCTRPCSDSPFLVCTWLEMILKAVSARHHFLVASSILRGSWSLPACPFNVGSEHCTNALIDLHRVQCVNAQSWLSVLHERRY